MSSDISNLAAMRRSMMDAIVIPHQEFSEAFSRLDCLVAHGKAQGTKSKMAAYIFAPSQTGKTTMLSEYQSLRNSVVPKGSKRVPVLFVTLEANTTKKGLAVCILDALEELGFTTGPYSGTELVLLKRVRALLRLAGVELLILDEVHHLVGKDEELDEKAYMVGETIKRMLIKGVCPIVLSGVMKGANILKNEQLAQRCIPAIKLPKLSTKTQRESEKFLRFLGAYLLQLEEQEIALNATAFIDGDVPLCIVEVTKGILGAACNLIKEAVSTMTFQGRNVLELADFAVAANGLFVEPGLYTRNPFIHGLAPMVAA